MDRFYWYSKGLPNAATGSVAHYFEVYNKEFVNQCLKFHCNMKKEDISWLSVKLKKFISKNMCKYAEAIPEYQTYFYKNKFDITAINFWSIATYFIEVYLGE